MSTPRGDTLFVNVSAAEARRRLKGFGHGVRKIRSAGRNRAMIIHTATGDHLRDLQNQFADAGFATTEADSSEPVDNLRNLGPTRSAWLHAAGIHTLAELRRFGPPAAFRLVKRQQPQADWNLLWALAAGLTDRDWRELTAEERERLRSEIERR